MNPIKSTNTLTVEVKVDGVLIEKYEFVKKSEEDVSVFWSFVRNVQLEMSDWSFCTIFDKKDN